MLARDKASGPINKVGDAFDRTGKKAHGLASTFGAITAGTRGLRTSFGLVGKGAALAAGAAGLGGLIAGLKGVYEEGREAQKVGAQTAAVIKSTGGVAKVSAGNVGALATAISNKVGVDDEAIQSGENMLLTFTRVRNEAGKGNRIFDQATQTITDMAAAMNHGVVTTDGLQKASIQVGKALNDPIKGVTALTKVGVTFTQKQKDQIKSLVEHGHALDAQKIILHELNSEFGGSAAAGTTAMQKLGVVFGNIRESVGAALLPTIDRVANWLSDKLPGAFQKAGAIIGPIIRTLGRGFSALAAAFSGEGVTSNGFVGVMERIGVAGRAAVGFIRETIIPGFQGLVSALSGEGVTSNGFVGVMENIGVVGKRVVDYVKNTIVPNIATAFGTVKDKIGTALTGIDLSGIARTFATQAAGWGTALIDGVRTGLETGDWSALGQTVGKGIASAIEGAGQFAKMIAGKIGDLLGKVDWVGIGISLGKQAPSLLVGLAAGILNFDLMGLLKGLAAHWQDVLLAVIAVAIAPARIIGKVGELLARIPLVGKLLAWGLEHFAAFSKGLFRMVGDALGFMGKAFLDGFRSVFPKIGESLALWLRLLPTRIGVAALDVAAAARRMIAGLGNAIRSMVGWVVRNIGQLIAQMLRPWVNAGGWLINAGLDVIRGLGRGLASAWPAVWRWIGGLRGAVGKLFNLAGNWLITAGYNIIGGLWSGFKSAMGGIGRILGSVKDAIIGGLKRLFGIRSPSTVMAGLGVHIITGLIKGMLTQSGALARTVKDLGGTALGIFPSLIGATQSTSSGAMQSMVKGYAQLLYGWGGRQWDALNMLLTRESGFNPNAQNPTSTAYGLFQFLDSTWAGVNATKTSNPQGQTLAGLRYIKQRYGDPVGAWNHELMAGWYGGGMPPTVFSKPTLIGVGERGAETVTVVPHSASGGGNAEMLAALNRVERLLERQPDATGRVVALTLTKFLPGGGRR